jgi:arabinosaccharide transport system substrate-binding protein
VLFPLIIQHGGGLFDANGTLIMDNDIACETMIWYVQQIRGKNKIADSMGSTTVGQLLTQAIDKDYFICLFMPDWRTKTFENDMPRMAGKFKLMPLPSWTKGGPRTTSWAGTMLGIPKNGRTDLAWDLAMKVYYDPETLSENFRRTNIIPPLKDVWQLPAFKEPRAFWSGQPIGSMYASIANEIPVFYTSPYYLVAWDKLGEALVVCSQYYAKNQDINFREFVKKTLREKADYVRAQINRNPYN